MKLIAALGLAIVLLVLIRRRLLQVDLSFPLFVGLVVLGLASLSDGFIHWTAIQLGFVDPPLAIIMIAIGILIAIIVALTIAVSRIRHQQLMLVRYLVSAELRRQELELERSTRKPDAS
jgi:hypothetical protein